MNQIQPQIQILTSKPKAGTLELLIRIVSPQPQETTTKRPPLNLALVIDRSGSMSGSRLEYAKAAAKYAISQLTPNDKASITIFDDNVETIIASQAVRQAATFNHSINTIETAGSTNLHGGWLEGANQAASSLEITRLNRVLLLSDGQANQGETRPAEIFKQVVGLAKKGISTSTMGVGEDFNEDLLEGIANNGDGNYHFINDPKMLPGIFAVELKGLLTTLGRIVSLGLEPRVGIKITDVLNDFEKTDTGRYKLDNLRFGQQLEVAVRLEVNAEMLESQELLGLRLAYTDTQGTRHVQKLGYALSKNQYLELGINVEVQEAIALLTTARSKLVVAGLIDAGNISEASKELKRQNIILQAMPKSAAIASEMALLDDLETNVVNNATATRKQAMSQRYERSKKAS
jgi:Ca-activated chloride channel homolog